MRTLVGSSWITNADHDQPHAAEVRPSQDADTMSSHRVALIHLRQWEPFAVAANLERRQGIEFEVDFIFLRPNLAHVRIAGICDAAYLERYLDFVVVLVKVGSQPDKGSKFVIFRFAVGVEE